MLPVRLGARSVVSARLVDPGNRKVVQDQLRHAEHEGAADARRGEVLLHGEQRDPRVHVESGVSKAE